MSSDLKAMLGLTRTEWEILRHRLEASDAIADALADQWPYDATIDLADRMASGESVELTEHAKAILADAVEGSTFVGAAEYAVTPQRLGQIIRAGYALARKIGELVGRELDFPTY